MFTEQQARAIVQQHGLDWGALLNLTAPEIIKLVQALLSLAQSKAGGGTPTLPNAPGS